MSKSKSVGLPRPKTTGPAPEGDLQYGNSGLGPAQLDEAKKNTGKGGVRTEGKRARPADVLSRRKPGVGSRAH